MTIYSYNERHVSKRTLFKSKCSVCGISINKRTKSSAGYLCRQCGPRVHMVREANSSMCEFCPQEMICSIRVQLGAWVYCENPDVADIERLKFAGGFDDEEVIAELANVLGGKGDREVLEKKVSKGATKIYQRYFNGKEGKIPNRIHLNSEL